MAEWQTQGTQNPPIARSCRFDPDLRHHARSRGGASVLEAVLFDLVVDRLERELEQLGGLALVAAGELEGLRDQAALDVGERIADRDPDDRGLASPQLRARQGAGEGAAMAKARMRANFMTSPRGRLAIELRGRKNPGSAFR